ncbi:hypothetical protein Taro_055869, partial [Colocasia esculenta]|nr:hypothetical protein [Colocasia esculenta]
VRLLSSGRACAGRRRRGSRRGPPRRRRFYLREGPNGFVFHVEVVTVAWDPRPREPVEGVLRATSVLELAATRRTPELRGKRWLGQWRVSHLQSSRGWSGTPRIVRSSTRRRPASPSSHCLAPYGPGTVWRGETSQQRQGARRAEETGQ